MSSSLVWRALPAWRTDRLLDAACTHQIKQGLSQEEVAEALARVKRQQHQGGSGSASNPSASLDGLYGDAPPPSPYSPPPPYPGADHYMDGPPPPPPPPPPMWHQPGVMLPGAMVAGLALGAGAAHLIRLRRRQEEQEEREQRMLAMEFQERRRLHHHQLSGQEEQEMMMQQQHHQQQQQQQQQQHQQHQQDEGMLQGESFSGSVGDSPVLGAAGMSPNEGEEGVGMEARAPASHGQQEHGQQQQEKEDSAVSMRELARAIETQAQALTALAQASERSRQDLHALLTGQVRAWSAQASKQGVPAGCLLADCALPGSCLFTN